MFYLPYMHIFTAIEIIAQVKLITGDKYDSDLAKRLNIDKQSIPQYKRKTTADIQLKIISLLINEIKNAENSQKNVSLLE